MKIPVSFRNNEEDTLLKEWILEESKIIGFSSYMKQLAYEKMKEKQGANTKHKEGQKQKNNTGLELDF